MREIKFRAWHKEKKEMDYLGKIFPAISDDWFAMSSSLGLGTHEENNYELMQYTGLSDKLGKEIYEGDIVKNVIGSITDIGTVGFKDGCFVADTWYPESNDSEAKSCEVIGNIYENK